MHERVASVQHLPKSPYLYSFCQFNRELYPVFC
uniref:Uncharacterized protein n=1 Tax=Anguilla anguilla TaxID=7936 RepID=A0A0E9QMS1_ANGAN